MKKPVIPKLALQMLNHLFMLIILSFVDIKEGQLSKQLAVKELEKQIIEFIVLNSYANFEVIVLPSNSEDKDNPLFSMVIKNYEYFKEDKDPRHFRIIIHNNWQGFDVYQKSVDGFTYLRV